MADISVLARLVGSIPRNVDIASNTLVTTSIKVGGGVSNTELTKAILDRLIVLQNGSDVDSSYHTHDGRYFTETELGSTSGTSGAQHIGVKGTPTNHTPGSQDVQAYLDSIDSALATAGGSAFSDAAFQVYDNGDITKIMVFQVSAIGTGTTRTVTMPNANVDLTDVNNAILKNGSRAFTADQPMGGFKLTGLAAGSANGHSVRYEQAILASGANAWSANQSLGGNKITNAANGTADQDYVTVAQLAAVSAGLDPKGSVRAATTVALPTATYDNGASGVGATLEGDLFATLPVIDGITLIVGNRLLVKNQADPIENGIYVVTDLGDGLAQGFILTRATDQDGSPAAEVSGGNFTFVEAGTTQIGSGWTVLWDGNVTLGTDNLNWTQFSKTDMVGGDMVTLTGNVISIDLLTNGGLKSSNPDNVAGELQIALEASNPTLEVNGSNELKVKYAAGSALTQGSGGLGVLVDNSTLEISTSIRIKDAGVTLAKLASNSVDENKIVSTTYSSTGAITGGSGTKVAVQVDNSSVEINSNALRVKTTAYDQATITGGSGSAAAVQNAPMIKKTMVAGEAFSANTTYAVRMAVNGETAGRLYKAEYDATTLKNYYVVGFIQPTGAISAGGTVTLIMMGEITLLSNDSAFAAGEVGEPVHLKSAGAWDALSQITYADLSNLAAVRVGMVQETNKIMVQSMQLNGIA